MGLNWSTSGRIDSFRFEKIDPNTFNKIGDLDCLVERGTISFAFYTELKVSGRLQVIKANKNMTQENYLIRVFYEPTLDGKKQSITIGTFYFTAELHKELGTYRGTVELRSTLARFIDDKTITKYTRKKGQDKKDAIEKFFKVYCSEEGMGAKWRIDATFKKKKYQQNEVFLVGQRVINVLKGLTRGNVINVDPDGTVIIQNKNSSGNKQITANKTSTVLVGVDKSNSIKEIANRAMCWYQDQYSIKQGEKTVRRKHIIKSDVIFPKGDYKDENIVSKTGRFITLVEKPRLTIPKSLEPDKNGHCDETKRRNYIKEELNSEAEQLLRQNRQESGDIYTFTTYYQDIRPGQVITFVYDDISVEGIVSDIDLDLEVGAKMTVKIKTRW